jgi:hypothetical protein
MFSTFVGFTNIETFHSLRHLPTHDIHYCMSYTLYKHYYLQPHIHTLHSSVVQVSHPVIDELHNQPQSSIERIS